MGLEHGTQGSKDGQEGPCPHFTHPGSCSAPDGHEARLLTLDVSLCPARPEAPEGGVAAPMLPCLPHIPNRLSFGKLPCETRLKLHSEQGGEGSGLSQPRAE